MLSPHPASSESLFVLFGSIMQGMSSSRPFLMSMPSLSQICVDVRCNDYNRVVIFRCDRDGHGNKYPPAQPEVLRLLAPQRGLTAIEKTKTHHSNIIGLFVPHRKYIFPELSNSGSPPAEPGVYPNEINKER